MNSLENIHFENQRHDVKEVCCENVVWIEQNQHHVHWLTLVLILLGNRQFCKGFVKGSCNVGGQMGENAKMSRMDVRKINCEDVHWIQLAQHNINSHPFMMTLV